MRTRLGCVPFLNAKPLIAQYFAQPELNVDVTFANPSLLGAMVDRGDVDAAIASSFFAIADPSLKVAQGVSISSLSTVESVRLFSKVPFDQIRALALDAASMTSNHLALILLSEKFGVRPQAEPRKAELGPMLKEFDAAVLIGDAGMAAPANGLHVMDLGLEWSMLTGLPFVWAVWVGRDGLTEALARSLSDAKEYGKANLENIAAKAAADLGWPVESCRHYLTHAIDFDLGPNHLKGFELFGRKCVEMGFVTGFEMPTLVGDACAGAATS